MACIENCDSNLVNLIYTTADGTYSLTNFISEGEFIEYDEAERMKNSKRDTQGNLYFAGSNYVTQAFSVKTHCTEEATALEAAWIASGGSLCGDLSTTSSCCIDRDFESVEITGITPPSLGDETGEYEFSFVGVPVV